MVDRRYPDRFRLNLRDPASYDIHWKRDQTLSFQLVAWDTHGVGDVEGVFGPGSVLARVRALPNQGSSALLERVCTAVTGHGGEYDLAFAVDDFPSLIFDLGQSYRVLWLDLSVNVTVNDVARAVPVFDGAGRAIFPLRVHQTMGVGS